MTTCFKGGKGYWRAAILDALVKPFLSKLNATDM